jgi:hypothetical protein
VDFQSIQQRRIFAQLLLLGAWRCSVAAINARGAVVCSSIDALSEIISANVMLVGDARTRYDHRVLSRNNHRTYHVHV